MTSKAVLPVPRRPIVLVPACNRWLGQHPFHVAGRKYVDAVRLAGCLPLVVPIATAEDVPELLALADGVLLTGSPSNVHPSHFGEAVHNPELPLDPARDGWTLPLIRQTIASKTPLLAICRGFQEINVALGGALIQTVQEAGPYRDHRANDADAVEKQYGPAHGVQVVRGGVLEPLLDGLMDDQNSFWVNSLHGQGVASQGLASGLRIEALAPDGLIESFSGVDLRHFLLGLQWHPEWQAQDNPVSMRLLQAFGAACVQHVCRTKGAN